MEILELLSELNHINSIYSVRDCTIRTIRRDDTNLFSNWLVECARDDSLLVIIFLVV